MAIIHYTAHPAIGGIESLIDHQCTVLADMGHYPLCIVGKGSAPANVKTIRIPAIDPGFPDAVRSMTVTPGIVPGAGHPLVCRLVTEISAALTGCTDCWIHNAMTVILNPYLTAALTVLVANRRDVRWVTWCADLSAVSRFVGRAPTSSASGLETVREWITWVSISDTRKQEMSAVLGLRTELIRVVNPPIDVLTWLDVGSQTRAVVRAVDLLHAAPVVLVPAKALPHKRLERAVALGSALVREGHAARILVTAAPSPHQPEASAVVLAALRRSIQRVRSQDAVLLLPDLLGTVATTRTVRELMQLSDVVLVPSSEEGFGMPLREAAALGVPLVCTDIPIFREVAGDAATYFGEDWADREVASLVLAAAGRRSNPARRSAFASLTQFRADLESLLSSSTQPNV